MIEKKIARTFTFSSSLLVIVSKCHDLIEFPLFRLWNTVAMQQIKDKEKKEK